MGFLGYVLLAIVVGGILFWYDKARRLAAMIAKNRGGSAAKPGAAAADQRGQRVRIARVRPAPGYKARQVDATTVEFQEGEEGDTWEHQSPL